MFLFTFTITFIIVLALFGYFIPTMIAILRKKKNTLAIFLLNLLLGYTLVGWLIALIWAVMYEDKDEC